MDPTRRFDRFSGQMLDPLAARTEQFSGRGLRPRNMGRPAQELPRMLPLNRDIETANPPEQMGGAAQASPEAMDLTQWIEQARENGYSIEEAVRAWTDQFINNATLKGAAAGKFNQGGMGR